MRYSDYTAAHSDGTLPANFRVLFTVQIILKFDVH